MPDPQIVVQTKKAVYYSGDLIEGQVILTLYEPLAIQTISITICGEESLHLLHRDAGHTKGCMDSFQFYNMTSTLFSHDGARDATEAVIQIKSGVYQFPFSGMLKSRTPATFSFETPYSNARILYTIRATVTPFGLPSAAAIESSVPVTVRPSHTVPTWINHFETSRDISFLCCLPQGSTKLAVTLDKNAYRPGDLVSSHVHVDHSKGQWYLRGIHLKLIQVMTFSAAKESYRHVTVIEALSSHASILAGQVEDRVLTLRIPDMCCLSTDGRLIKCQYEIEFTVDVPFSSDMIQAVPITIYA